MATAKKVTKEKAVKAKVEKAPKKVKAVSVSKVSAKTGDVSAIFSPRITEKAGMLSDAHVYTFNVDTRTNKVEIAKAFEAMYKVKPLKVRIVVIKARNVMKRGRPGKVSGGKKAMIYVRKGDKIEFI